MRTQLTHPRTGHPLYEFVADTSPGAVNGENITAFNAVWQLDTLKGLPAWLLGANGKPDPGPLSIASMPSAKGQVLAVNPPSPFAARPFAVYAFSADTASASACTGACARFWETVLVTGTPTAAAGSGVQQSGLDTITRPDGTEQVTYFGHPLYFFAFDQPGQDLGEGISAFGGTFTVVSLTGVPEKRGMR